MQDLKKTPLNIVGYNLNSGYGNFTFDKTWEMSAKKIMDPGKALRNRGANILETSCDESDSKLV